MKSRVLLALGLGIVAMAALPGMAHADSLEAAKHGVFPESAAINSMWVIVAGCLVMFMQAGFAFLEIGFSRGKNVGTVVAKILLNFSIAAIGFYAVGFAFAFGTGELIGSSGYFLQDFGNPLKAFPVMGLSDATVEAKWFFQFTFCAVSLAIVWGTTLERIKFGVYVIYAIVFSTLIYPIGAHWVFGGGWLQANVGMQDFAGSTAVHLIGATGGLAVLLLLGARKGKYGSDGKPRPIPGHSMPLFGLGVIILWLGWFGFNPGSTLGALDGRFTEILMITMIAAASGVIAAAITSRLLQRTLDIGMIGNGAIAGLVAITAPSGYVEQLGGDPDRPHRRSDRRRRRPRDRQGPRRPGRGAERPRPGRYLGHPGVRLLHLAAAGPVQRLRRSRGRAVLLRDVHAARPSGAGHRGRVLVRVRGQLRDLLADQEGLRAPRQRGPGGSRPRHLRARDVRIPRAVHPAGGVWVRFRGVISGPSAGADSVNRDRNGRRPAHGGLGGWL